MTLLETGEPLLDLPPHPNFTAEDLEGFRRSGDWGEFFFEWFKYLAELAVTGSFLIFSSPAVKKSDQLRFTVCAGLLNRIARISLAHMHLSHEGKFGETTRILDRSLHETCINVVWLCSPDPDRLRRYLAEGLRSDAALRAIIDRNVSERGYPLVIEERMLRSIQRAFDRAGLTGEDLRATRALPNLFDRMQEAGFTRDQYVATQRMASHAVHGTWSELLFSYLVDDDGDLSTRSEDVRPHANQFLAACVFMLEALESFWGYFLVDPAAKVFTDLFQSIRSEILEKNAAAAASDYEPFAQRM